MLVDWFSVKAMKEEQSVSRRFSSRRTDVIFLGLLSLVSLMALKAMGGMPGYMGIGNNSSFEESKTYQTPVYSFINASGDTVIDASKYQKVEPFAEGLAPVWLTGRGWGFIDINGGVVIEPQFEEVERFSEGLAGARKGGNWGFINKSGEFVINPRFTEIHKFSEDLAVVSTDNRMCFIDKQGREVFARDHTELRWKLLGPGVFSNGLMAVVELQSRKVGFVDRTGEFLIEPMFIEAGNFSEGLARVSVQVRDEEKLAFIDRAGTVVLPPKFNTDADFERNSTDFHEGLASLTENLSPTVTEPEKFVYIDTTGNIVLRTDFFYAGPFSEGLAAVYDADSDHWGFIDKSGRLAIPLKYKLVMPFSDGLACVAKAPK